MSDFDFDGALALLEYDSIAVGIEAGDAMVKRSAVDVIHAGTVHPGRFLVLVGGSVADVEEAVEAADRLGEASLVRRMFLADPHPSLVAGLGGARLPGEGEALGIIETRTVASVILAADAGLKGALVTLREIFMADGLGGKGYLLFSGALVEVQAAVELGSAAAGTDLFHARIVARLHDEMNANLLGDGRFASRLRGG